jgi:FXSXX-COOH protein
VDVAAVFPPLADVTATPLHELRGGDTVLGRALERLVESVDDPDGVISAFGSFVTDN